MVPVKHQLPGGAYRTAYAPPPDDPNDPLHPDSFYFMANCVQCGLDMEGGEPCDGHQCHYPDNPKCLFKQAGMPVPTQCLDDDEEPALDYDELYEPDLPDESYSPY